MIQIPKYILRPRPVSELRLHVEMQQQVLTQATATPITLLKMIQRLKYIPRLRTDSEMQMNLGSQQQVFPQVTVNATNITIFNAEERLYLEITGRSI